MKIRNNMTKQVGAQIEVLSVMTGKSFCQEPPVKDISGFLQYIQTNDIAYLNDLVRRIDKNDDGNIHNAKNATGRNSKLELGNKIVHRFSIEHNKN